jgi:hypothetical protein
VLMHSHDNPDPAKFDGLEWISAPYTTDGRTVFALVHNEYQGDRHSPSCQSRVYLKCWYNAITLAVSRNGGRSFSHARPPNHLVAAVPYRYTDEAGPFGFFSPSNVIYRPDDRYYYAFVRAEKYREQPHGSCLMRTRNLADPTSWRVWNGEGFTVRFINPYLEPSAPARDHVCQPVAPNEIATMAQSVTFNTYLRKYVLVGRSGETTGGKRITGVYFGVSDDLVHWSPRHLLLKAEFADTYRCGDRQPIAYPVLLDPRSRARNLDTTGRRPYLYFTKLHYKCVQGSVVGTPNRDLLRVPIEFDK